MDGPCEVNGLLSLGEILTMDYFDNLTMIFSITIKKLKK
jgi:hypothetical protein